jgi:hypothetical protein
MAAPGGCNHVAPLALHAGGRRFESCTAHSRKPCGCGVFLWDGSAIGSRRPAALTLTRSLGASPCGSDSEHSPAPWLDDHGLHSPDLVDQFRPFDHHALVLPARRRTAWQQWQRSAFARVRRVVQSPSGFRSTTQVERTHPNGREPSPRVDKLGSLVRAQYRPSEKAPL